MVEADLQAAELRRLLDAPLLGEGLEVDLHLVGEALHHLGVDGVLEGEVLGVERVAVLPVAVRHRLPDARFAVGGALLQELVALGDLHPLAVELDEALVEFALVLVAEARVDGFALDVRLLDQGARDGDVAVREVDDDVVADRLHLDAGDEAGVLQEQAVLSHREQRRAQARGEQGQGTE